MTETADFIHNLYARFNDRDVDGVLAMLDPQVEWANGMEGGHVRGHAATAIIGAANGLCSIRASTHGS